MASLGEIEVVAKRLADSRELLKLRVDNLNVLIEELKRKHMEDIKKAAADAANARLELEALVDESRHLFKKPKTIIISGIKVGLKKGAGAVVLDDEAMVIKRIKKLFKPEDHELYIKVTEKVKKKPLEDLDAATLKKLGVRLEGTEDVVLVKPVESDVDKIVNAMLKEAAGAAGDVDEMEDAA